MGEGTCNGNLKQTLCLLTREIAIMTQAIYVRRCGPGWVGRPGSLGVRGSQVADFARGRGSRGAGRGARVAGRGSLPPATLPTLTTGGGRVKQVRNTIRTLPWPFHNSLTADLCGIRGSPSQRHHSCDHGASAP